MASPILEAFKELPPWAKWTGGLVAAGGAAFLLIRRPGAAPAAAPAPRAVDAGGSAGGGSSPGGGSTTPVTNPGGAGGPDWTGVIRAIVTSQASLTQSQSSLASQIQNISAHQVSAGAATGSTAVPLSGGSVASDKDSRGSGVSAAEYASGQTVETRKLEHYVVDDQHAGYIQTTIRINTADQFQTGIWDAKQAYLQAEAAGDKSKMATAHAYAEQLRNEATSKKKPLPDWAK